jgi:flagellin-like protein
MAPAIHDNLIRFPKMAAPDNAHRPAKGASGDTNSRTKAKPVSGCAEGLNSRGREAVLLNRSMQCWDNAISLVQTMDSAAEGIQERLMRMKELARLAAARGEDPAGLRVIKGKFDSLHEEISHIAGTAEYNGIRMLHASSAANRELHMVFDKGTSPKTPIVKALPDFRPEDTLTLALTDRQGIARTINLPLTECVTLDDLISQINDAFGPDIEAEWDSSLGMLVRDPTPGPSRVGMRLFRKGSLKGSFSVLREGDTPYVSAKPGARVHGDRGEIRISKHDLTPRALGLDHALPTDPAGPGTAVKAVARAIALVREARSGFREASGMLKDAVMNRMEQAQDLAGTASAAFEPGHASELARFLMSMIGSRGAGAAFSQTGRLFEAGRDLLGRQVN